MIGWEGWIMGGRGDDGMGDGGVGGVDDGP